MQTEKKLQEENNQVHIDRIVHKLGNSHYITIPKKKIPIGSRVQGILTIKEPSSKAIIEFNPDGTLKNAVGITTVKQIRENGGLF